MKFGITSTFQCSYLASEEERLLVFVDNDDNQNIPPQHVYDHLIQFGFRRSGQQIYRPHCPACSACQSLRIPVEEFKPSKSQKRLKNKNRRLFTQTSNEIKPSYYPLYAKYINQRHTDSSMYPPSEAQLLDFVDFDLRAPMFIEAYDGDTLIAVAVTDAIETTNQIHDNSGLSALYTFFDPDYADLSIGTWMILEQINWCLARNTRYLYLGYFIEPCENMRYKQNFYPHERFIDQNWYRFDKK